MAEILLMLALSTNQSINLQPVEITSIEKSKINVSPSGIDSYVWLFWNIFIIFLFSHLSHLYLGFLLFIAEHHWRL